MIAKPLDVNCKGKKCEGTLHHDIILMQTFVIPQEVNPEVRSVFYLLFKFTPALHKQHGTKNLQALRVWGAHCVKEMAPQTRVTGGSASSLPKS